MQIVRFLYGGRIHIGQQIDDGTALEIEGDLFGPHRVTERRLQIDKLLSAADSHRHPVHRVELSRARRRE